MTLEKNSLRDKKIAIITTDGFEEIELTAPMEELKGYGAEVQIVADSTEVRSWKNKNWGAKFNVDLSLHSLKTDDYDALIIPGGVINADKLRRNEKAVEIIRKFHEEKKLIAAICHGPQLLIEADLVKNKEMTSHPALKTDMINAGAKYENHGVVTDNNFITAQGANDVSSFLKKITAVLKERS